MREKSLPTSSPVDRAAPTLNCPSCLYGRTLPSMSIVSARFYYFAFRQRPLVFCAAIGRPRLCHCRRHWISKKFSDGNCDSLKMYIRYLFTFVKGNKNDGLFLFTTKFPLIWQRRIQKSYCARLLSLLSPLFSPTSTCVGSTVLFLFCLNIKYLKGKSFRLFSSRLFRARLAMALQRDYLFSL